MGLQRRGGSDPLKLEQGKLYSAQLRLSGFLACYAPLSMVAGKFQSLGFDNVEIWDAPPPDFPAPLRNNDINCNPTGSECCRWVRGRWLAADMSLNWPEEVMAVYDEDEQAEPVPQTPAEPPDKPETPETPSPAETGGILDRTCNVREAAAVLERALVEEKWSGTNRAAKQILLSIGLFEGGWGCAPFLALDRKTKIRNENNWGAIHCRVDAKTGEPLNPAPGAYWYGCVSASDTADGTNATARKTYFRAYKTSLLGCRDLLRWLSGIREELNSGNADAVATAMKEVYRYGVPIDTYATAIYQNAKTVAKGLNQELSVTRGNGVAGLSMADTVALGALVLSAAAGTGAYFVRKRNERLAYVLGGVSAVSGLVSTVAVVKGRLSDAG